METSASRRTRRVPDALRAEWLRCSPTFAPRPPRSSARRRSRSARRRRPLSRPKATAECSEDASCPTRCIMGGKGAVRPRAQTPTGAVRATPVALIRAGEPRAAAGDAIAGPGRQSSSSPHASSAAAPHLVATLVEGVPLPTPTLDELPPLASDAPLALDRGAIAFPLSQSPPSPSLMSSQSSAPIASSSRPRARWVDDDDAGSRGERPPSTKNNLRAEIQLGSSIDRL